MITLILKERLFNFIECEDIFPFEQMGCKKESDGRRDQLLVNKMIMENYRSKQKNLSMTWIDYKKAFDNVFHEWILK